MFGILGRRSAALTISFVLLGLASLFAHADVVATTDAEACPKIADHVKFLVEVSGGNAYEYPSTCVELMQGGHRYTGPLKTKTVLIDGDKFRYFLIQVGKRKLWTSASWVEVVKGSASPVPVISFLGDSKLWYAKPLRARFGKSLPFHGMNLEVDRLPCLPRDITKFNIVAGSTGSAMAVRGAISVGNLPSPFRLVNGPQGPQYLLELEAYLFSPSGRLLWKQQGSPRDGWTRADGQTADFLLIGSYEGTTHGDELWVVAIGDPILSSSTEGRAVLGAKRIRMP